MCTRIAAAVPTPCICRAAFFPVPAEQLSLEDGAQKGRQQLHPLGLLPALLQPICIVSGARKVAIGPPGQQRFGCRHLSHMKNAQRKHVHTTHSGAPALQTKLPLRRCPARQPGIGRQRGPRSRCPCLQKAQVRQPAKPWVWPASLPGRACGMRAQACLSCLRVMDSTQHSRRCWAPSLTSSQAVQAWVG